MSSEPVPRRTSARQIFDAHFHVIDPRFPLIANAGYVPSPFTVDDYRARTAGLGVVGGAVVAGSFHGFAEAYLLDALARLGPGFVGVIQLPATVADGRVRRLDRAGVRGVRCNLVRGGSEVLGGLDALARRVYDLVGWHVELYLDARDVPLLASTVAALPAVSIDHLGLSAEGLPHVLRLVERGVRVKASGFGRGDLDVAAALRAIAAANPRALMFGTDLPSTRAPRPFASGDVELISDVLDPALVPAVLHDNAASWYRGRGGG